MPYSGAPISVVDSFQVWFGEDFSGAPISVIDSFEVVIAAATPVSGAKAAARGAFGYSVRWFNIARNFF